MMSTLKRETLPPPSWTHSFLDLAGSSWDRSDPTLIAEAMGLAGAVAGRPHWQPASGILLGGLYLDQRVGRS